MKRLTCDNVIKRIKEIHGNLYDCSEVNYVNAKTKIKLYCNKHNIWFETTPNGILYKKSGCPKCRYEKSSAKTRMSLESFLEKAKKIHGEKYDYSNVEYVNNRTNVRIICKKHGEFLQTPDKHIIRKHGCPICGGSKKKTLEQFICEANKIHNCKYDYSKSIYNGNKKQIIIICPIHGIFQQTPKDHLHGQGCPHCRQSKIEQETQQILLENNITFTPQYRYDKRNFKNRLDFFINDANLAIECQGAQHFKPVDFANKGEVWSNELFENNVKRDIHKMDLCKNTGIKLFYYVPDEQDKRMCLNNKLFGYIYTEENTFSDLKLLLYHIKQLC